MNISKLAIPVSQSAALSVSAACIFLFSLPPFRSDFFPPFSKRQPLQRCPFLLCLLKLSPFNLCTDRQGEAPLGWWQASVCSGLLCVPLRAAITLCSSPSFFAWGWTPPPPAPLRFHRHSSTSAARKHELCLHHSLHPGTSMSNPASCSSHHKNTPSFLIMLFMLRRRRRGSSFALLLVSLLKAQHASVVASHVPH